MSALSEEWSDLKLNKKRFILNFIPGVSIAFITYYVVLIIKDLIEIIWEGITEIPFIERIIERRDNKKRLKEELKYRKYKIKYGIIKITLNDPYGEENWNE